MNFTFRTKATLDLKSILELSYLVPEELNELFENLDSTLTYTVILTCRYNDGDIEFLAIDENPVVASQTLYLENGIVTNEPET